MIFGRSEKIIRRQIDIMDMNAIAVQKDEIELAIKYTYLQGRISKKKYHLLNKLVREKYIEVTDKYFDNIT